MYWLSPPPPAASTRFGSTAYLASRRSACAPTRCCRCCSPCPWPSYAASSWPRSPACTSGMVVSVKATATKYLSGSKIDFSFDTTLFIAGLWFPAYSLVTPSCRACAPCGCARSTFSSPPAVHPWLCAAASSPFRCRAKNVSQPGTRRPYEFIQLFVLGTCLFTGGEMEPILAVIQQRRESHACFCTVGDGEP